MKVSTQNRDKFGIIKFDSDKILGTEAGEFQENLIALLENKIKYIIVDLTGVKFVSSWGIGMLMHGLATTKNRSAEFRIAGMNDKVAKTFKNVKIFSVLDIFDSLESAMK